MRRSCVTLGIVLCEPEALPLPLLLRIAGKPNADEYLPETQLAELVRLAPEIEVKLGVPAPSLSPSTCSTATR